MIRRGDVMLAELSPVVGHEQGGRRPVLVLSPSAYNAWPIGMAVIAPITSRDRRLRHHIPIGREAGLHTTPSFVMPEYVRAISQQRLTGLMLGAVRPATLDEVEQWVSQFTSEAPF
ncbi:type II toxin-antitoxin system PemK/MazF family toxin [Dactylosporangium sp. NPDC005555]|uniref:type II toxin-antitoxin system PemK/MazF family toxin n=1 Tax=Dactylosporangium sp. NPDC005555 TaxID=3154889 RepID=UPI0033B6E7D7